LPKSGYTIPENAMKLARSIAVAALLAAPLAEATLPPPTPEQLAAEQNRRTQEEVRLAKEKEQLERAQDRVAERYRKDRAAAQASGSVDKADLPQNTKVAPGSAAPEGGRRQSAEAHSAPAK
jgi:hypothetical protein